jgi:hypothetical protein
MDEGTHQNAAMVEQASAAAGSMQEQANKLAELTSFFKFQCDDGVIAAAAPRQAPARAPSSARSPGRPAASLPAGKERRSTSRPWSRPDAAAPAALSVEWPRPVVAGSGRSDDWSEF